MALGAGAVVGLAGLTPRRDIAAKLSKHVLQICVIGLGFGIPLAEVVQAGASGIVFTVLGVIAAIALGVVVGRWLQVEEQTSLLLTVGTAICGGSAIAAVGQAIRARPNAMTVSLATVFLLNAVALYIFPPIGHALHLSQQQFAVWAAIGIHDTSSVVGAAATYGSVALHRATVLKLARALWIVPATFMAAAYYHRRSDDVDTRPAVKIPWFIVLFLVAALLRTLFGGAHADALDLLARIARYGLVVTLFLIGAQLTRATLRDVGVRPLVQAVLVWLALGGLALLAVDRIVPA